MRQINIKGMPEPERHPRVWEVKEYEHWAAYDWESLKEVYMETTGLDEEDAFNDPYELDDDQLLGLKIKFDDAPEVTFRGYLDHLISTGAKFPRVFAVSADAA